MGLCYRGQTAAISLLEVVEAIDGPERAFRCTEIRKCSPVAVKDPAAYRGRCFIKRRMLQAEAVWRASLNDQTLADLLAEGGEVIDPRNLAASADWIGGRARTSRPG